MLKNLLAIGIVTFFFLASISPAHAVPDDSGEYYYQSVNFTNKQTIVGTSFEFEITALDIYWDFGGTETNPYLANKEFKVSPHYDLKGATCTMTQPVSNAQGRIKAKCSVGEVGRFVFQIEPTFDNYPKSKQYEVTFVSSKDQLPKPSIDPDMPKYTVTPITTDIGACASGYGAGSGFVSCDGGKGYTSMQLKCRNGYTARIDFGRCMGNNDRHTDTITRQICGDSRCTAQAKPSTSPKPVSSLKPQPVNLATAAAMPVATIAAQLDSGVDMIATPSAAPAVAPQKTGWMHQLKNMWNSTVGKLLEVIGF